MRRQLSLSFPRQLGQAARLLLALLLVAAVAAPLQAAPAGPDAPDAVTIYKVYVSGVRDTNFTVSWTTDAATDGYVDWGPTTALGATTADAVTSTRTHHVTIPPEPDKLTASTTYYFRVRSGGATDDNMGDLYTVMTGRVAQPFLRGPNRVGLRVSTRRHTAGSGRSGLPAASGCQRQRQRRGFAVGRDAHR